MPYTPCSTIAEVLRAVNRRGVHERRLRTCQAVRLGYWRCNSRVAAATTAAIVAFFARIVRLSRIRISATYSNVGPSAECRLRDRLVGCRRNLRYAGRAF